MECDKDGILCVRCTRIKNRNNYKSKQFLQQKNKHEKQFKPVQQKKRTNPKPEKPNIEKKKRKRLSNVATKLNPQKKKRKINNLFQRQKVQVDCNENRKEVQSPSVQTNNIKQEMDQNLVDFIFDPCDIVLTQKNLKKYSKYLKKRIRKKRKQVEKWTTMLEKQENHSMASDTLKGNISISNKQTLKSYIKLASEKINESLLNISFLEKFDLEFVLKSRRILSPVCLRKVLKDFGSGNLKLLRYKQN
eukprot:snap_masked-scaffold_15-processed-gene-0.11-mRNA-1 protein AED:1.00 eAED:1.00 QI:0/-1/0/0/-1/1/1/0/246